MRHGWLKWVLGGLGLAGLALIPRRARAADLPPSGAPPTPDPLDPLPPEPAGPGGPAITVYRLSEDGLARLRAHEGARRQLYDDPAGHCTVGVGHLVHRGPCILPKGPMAVAQAGTTHPDVQAEWPFKDGLSEAGVLDLLRRDVAVREGFVKAQLAGAPVTQAQYDVLVSFVFNVGTGRADALGLFDAIRRGDYGGAARIIAEGPTAGGLPGLVARRADEAQRFQGLA